MTIEYLNNPYNFEIQGKYSYCEVGLLSLPSSRNIIYIR